MIENASRWPSNYNDNRPSNYNDNRPSNYNNNRPCNYNNRPCNYNNNRPSNYNDNRPSNYNDNRPSNYNDNRPSNYNNNRPSNYNDNRPSNYNDNRPSNYNNNRPCNYNNNRPQLQRQQALQLQRQQALQLHQQQALQLHQQQALQLQRQQALQLQQQQALQLQRQQALQLQRQQALQLQRQQALQLHQQQALQLQQQQALQLQQQQAALPSTTTTGPATTTTPTTPFKDPCNTNPCGTGSTCEVRYNDTYVCLCLAGDSYNNVSKSCERSKVFPGNLQVKKPFKDEMTDTTSKEFIETANEIIAELDEVYNEKDGYSRSIVLKLLPRTTRVSRASSEVIASVQIIFEASSEITDDQVVQTLLTECTDCSVIEKTFEITNLCDDTPCDEHSTNCKSGDGAFSCICNQGYMQTDYSNRMCIACPLGEKLKDNECVPCSFGYSGFNCSEKWQLILVIVGSVLGGLLLIALILLPVVATQKLNMSFKKNKSAEMEKPYTNLSSAAQPMASNKFGHSQGVSFNRSGNGNSGFQNGGVPVFPRATTITNIWDNRTNLEMKPSNGQQNFRHMNSGSRLYDESYDQAQSQNNSCAQNKPTMNPYTQNQGHSVLHTR
ncbi:uncharacterized protein LOC120737891 [Simochromis diagramma]|uniref:uncharacterized protein LOC120737891 n=1 Tax=Simochromis diagramma TaxID=43689 RepID=UPI001A7EF48D|nr:uncharacterized protein LOC120737891 [Simochromis diagramma]